MEASLQELTGPHSFKPGRVGDFRVGSRITMMTFKVRMA
jgi:hypothetical protein